MSAWRKELKETLQLGVPMAFAQISHTLMGATDVALVGRLQGESLAAMAVGQAAYGLLLSLGMGIVAAVGPLVSQAHGAGNKPVIARTVAVGVGCSFLLSLLFWPLLYGSDLLFYHLDYPPEMRELATGYCRAVMWGLPFAFLFLVQKNYLDSISRPRWPMVCSLLGILVNGLADYAFMYGRFGFPELGVAGTGLATSAVNGFMALALIPMVWNSEFVQALWRQKRQDWKEFLEIGVPIAGSIGIEVVLFVVGALMMGKLGSDEAGAHQIVLTCAATTFMVPLGVSFAGTTRVGQAVGRRDFAAVRPAGVAAITVGTCFMVLTAGLFLLWPDFFVELFWEPGLEKSPKVGVFAAELLVIAGFFQIADGIQVTSIGALRGPKDVNIPLLVAIFSYWFVGMGSASYMTFYTSLRHRGLWLGFLLGLITAALILGVRFLLLSTRLTHDEELQKAASAEAT